MTITEQELTYIAEHWLSHKIIHIHSWGISKIIANPETYLAIYRQFPFIEYTISVPKNSFPISYSISPSIEIEKHELAFIRQDWYTFLEYENIFDYQYDLLNTYAKTVKKIVNRLLPYSISLSSSSSERIYTLE